jgi:hypothetical protein
MGETKIVLFLRVQASLSLEARQCFAFLRGYGPWRGTSRPVHLRGACVPLALCPTSSFIYFFVSPKFGCVG